MAENQGFLKGVSENLLEICDFYAKWDSEAFSLKKGHAMLNCWTMAVSASQPVQVNPNELKNSAICFPKNLHGNLQ